MDFNYKLARKNVELFKHDFAKGLRIGELQTVGKGTGQAAYLYENLVIKQPIKEDFQKENEKYFKQYNKLLVKLSNKGIEQNLKFAPILDYIKDENRFCTISPYIDGTELPDCTNEQMWGIGVDGMKKYLDNNLRLASICLSPEFHDACNFKLSTQGNINVIDYSTWHLLNNVWAGYPIKPFKNKAYVMEKTNEKSCVMILCSNFDNKVTNNLYMALEQTPNSKYARKMVERELAR